MDIFTLIVLFIHHTTSTLLFVIIVIQLPFYFIVFTSQLTLHFIQYYKYKYIFKKTPTLKSCNVWFPEHYSGVVILCLLWYTPKYIAYCTFLNILKFNKTNFNIQNILVFVLIRLWVYITGLPLIVFKLFQFWRQFLIHSWLYYDQLDVTFFFVNFLNEMFKKKK